MTEEIGVSEEVTAEDMDNVCCQADSSNGLKFTVIGAAAAVGAYGIYKYGVKKIIGKIKDRKAKKHDGYNVVINADGSPSDTESVDNN